MNIVYLLGIVLAFVFVIFGITFDPGGTGGLMVGPFNLDTLINFVDPTSTPSWPSPSPSTSKSCSGWTRSIRNNMWRS